MIRVHCFVSCVCEALKRVPGVDERPYYFGVWDAPFEVTERFELSYHGAAGTKQEFFRHWYERLYGARIREWYDHDAPREVNVRRLAGLVEDRPPGRNVLAMVDLFRLPERENKFNQDPFPHIVMLQSTDDPQRWLMQDPDFRWEGTLPKERILDAARSPAVAGGFLFDDGDVRPASESAAREYFAACMSYPHNPLTAALRRIVHAHLDVRARGGLPALAAAVRQIPVMAIRKYAYEHGLAFFWRALALDVPEFERWCDEVEALVKGYTAVQFRALKLSLSGDREHAAGVLQLLDEQDAREGRIKQCLIDVYDRWCADLDAPVRPMRTNPRGIVQ